MNLTNSNSIESTWAMIQSHLWWSIKIIRKQEMLPPSVKSNKLKVENGWSLRGWNLKTTQSWVLNIELLWAFSIIRIFYVIILDLRAIYSHLGLIFSVENFLNRKKGTPSWNLSEEPEWELWNSLIPLIKFNVHNFHPKYCNSVKIVINFKSVWKTKIVVRIFFKPPKSRSSKKLVHECQENLLFNTKNRTTKNGNSMGRYFYTVQYRSRKM